MPAYGFTSRCVQNAALPSSAGCCQRHEPNRTNAADCGLSDVTGAGDDAEDGVSGVDGDDADRGVWVPSPGGSRLNGSLLKLNANGCLQRPQGAQFFRSDERQRAPG